MYIYIYCPEYSNLILYVPVSRKLLELEYEDYLLAKSSCREQNDEEYCLERGTCFPNTKFCRYCYSWICAKQAKGVCGKGIRKCPVGLEPARSKKRETKSKKGKTKTNKR